MAAQLRKRRELMSSGARRLGWKAGFGSKAAMERLGTSAPLFAFLLDRTLVESGSSVSIKGWKRPVFEAEIAVHLGTDVHAGANARETKVAIAGLGPAIELADLDASVTEVEEILAGGTTAQTGSSGTNYFYGYLVKGDTVGQALELAKDDLISVYGNEQNFVDVVNSYTILGDPALSIPM